MYKKIILLLLMLSLMTGCVASTPKDALKLSPESLANRQLQTRRYDTGNDNAVLIAANAVLQDLGFNLDETDPELGVVVASKERDATDGGQVFLLALLGALGNNPNAVNSADSTQKVRVSLVVRPLDKEGESAATDLTPERIEAVKVRVHDAIYEGLRDNFPKDACENIAKTIAENTADTLANDLDTLLSVKDTPGSTAVRVTFQQVVYNRLGQINVQRQIEDEQIYKEFFEKLSKSLFLESNAI
jgi:hypothetical protein